MRSYDDIYASAREQSPFSNHTDGSQWMTNWCERCRNPVELAYQRYVDGKRKTRPKTNPGGCPLLCCAMAGRTPLEWLDQHVETWIGGGDRYHCIEFRGPDGGGEEPRPKPEPPNMDGLFPRPQRGVRMLKPLTEHLEISRG